jgi:pentatricopeptide repeat protein
MLLEALWPEFSLASKMFRYAALALGSQVDNGTTSVDTMQYIQKFYEYAIAAIEASSIHEIIVGSYTMLLYSYAAHERFETALVYFKGLCEGVGRLQYCTDDSKQTAFMHSLWEEGFQLVYRIFWATNEPRLHPLQYDFEALDELNRVTATLMFPASEDNGTSNITRNRLDTLDSYLAFY